MGLKSNTTRPLEDSRRRKRPDALQLLLLLLLVCAQFAKGGTEAWLKSEKHADIGTEIQLPCLLEIPQCNGLHSIKWYQGSERIFVYSADGEMTLANDEVASRMAIILPKNNTKNNTTSYLKISNLTLEDEALYECEVTYLAVKRECNNVQHITLNITVPPTSVRVIDESTKKTLEDGRVLGPIIEGSAITLRCESGKGRPVPTVEWYNAGVKLKSENSTELEEHNIGTGSGTLNLVVARKELGATFTCKVSSIALQESLKIDIKLDVHVRPMKMGIKGVVGHVIQGSKVLLQCEVQAARPPATVTWYNGTEILEKNHKRIEMYETKLTDNADGTTQTNSFLAFTATEYDNGRKFSCAAVNSVMIKEGSKPMKETVIIEVMYPPIVRMSPKNITVNETEDFQLFCDYEANPATLINVVWQRDGKNLTLIEDRYEGGTNELTSLLVKNSTSSDIGKYSCILENDFGASNSNEFINVSVFYRPTVEVTLEPDTPVNEAGQQNVSLSCNMMTGNPPNLKAVRWYLDGDLLKELPDCVRNASVEEFCDIDPSKLLLESVGRSFHGNYSCEGKNEAGWGPISSNTPVIVHYKPGPASISYSPRRVIKKGPLNITCSVKDPGRPKVRGFKWYRGPVRLSEVNASVHRVEKVRLEDRVNYTCLAFNEAGDGDSASTFVNISAPPAFIKKLPQLVGFVYNATNVSLNCNVECSPMCEIYWMKNNQTIDLTESLQYYVKNERAGPNLHTDDFESINSSLIWNLTAWPTGMLDRLVDNDDTFTCMSSSNGIGPGVSSTVKIEIYFPPESASINYEKVNIIVDTIPPPIVCNATARPDPQYRWFREGKTEVISEGPVLQFKTPFPRNSRGTYICQASNKIGSASKATFLNVQYKPECQIDKEVMDGKDYVVCSADGNPPECGYKWSLKSDNDTIDQVPFVKNGKSYLLLEDTFIYPRIYICVANNTIGASNSCERHIPANIPWWMRLDGDLLVIVIAATVIIILVLIVVSVVIFLVCRRKHGKLKYNSRVVEMEEREHPEGGPPSPTASSNHSTQPPQQQQQQQPPAPRWPLKPGVLVHINRTHSMRSGLGPRLGVTSSALPSPPLSSVSRISDSTPLTAADESLARDDGGPVRPFRRAPKEPAAPGQSQPRQKRHRHHRHHHSHSLSEIRQQQQQQDEGMLARANRIRAMFSVQLKESDTFPGISRGKTAVTYKRIAPRQQLAAASGAQQPEQEEQQRANEARNNVSRKRKKPGADPGQTVNSSHHHMDSVSEGLSEPETKTFYENLPFHGIQSPPNKLGSPKLSSQGRSSSCFLAGSHSPSLSPCSSRPASRAASVCGGSSGYESSSARTAASSHLGPHYSDHNMPRANSPEPRCNSLKPRRRKQQHHLHQQHPRQQPQQFYSLRLCRKHQQHRRQHHHQSKDERGFQLYAVPLSCPHRSPSSSTIATSLRSLDCTPTSTLSRGGRGGRTEEAGEELPPPPVPTPRLRDKTDPCEHTYQNVPPPVFPPSSPLTAADDEAIETLDSSEMLKTSSIYDYKEHYQQQQQEMQQYGYPLPSNSSSQLTLPLTRSLYHSSSVGPLQNSYVHTSSRHSLNTASHSSANQLHHQPQQHHHHLQDSGNLSFSLLQQVEIPDLAYDRQYQPQQQQQSRRHSNSSSRSRTERRKYRNKHERNERKHKQHQLQQQQQQLLGASCETSFERAQQDLSVPESYKISYPHYYEDVLTENPLDYQSRDREPSEYDLVSDTTAQFHDDQHGNLTKNRAKPMPIKRYSPQACNSKLAELHFHDVGQEIDV